MANYSPRTFRRTAEHGYKAYMISGRDTIVEPETFQQESERSGNLGRFADSQRLRRGL